MCRCLGTRQITAHVASLGSEKRQGLDCLSKTVACRASALTRQLEKLLNFLLVVEDGAKFTKALCQSLNLFETHGRRVLVARCTRLLLVIMLLRFVREDRLQGFFDAG